MRTINTDIQRYEEIISHHDFYVDKTLFIKEWWEHSGYVTVINRPYGFGKTLNIDMLKCFFANEYMNRSDLFEGFNIWKEQKYSKLQGTYPVISFSFTNVRQNNFKDARLAIIKILRQVFQNYTKSETEGSEGKT